MFLQIEYDRRIKVSPHRLQDFQVSNCAYQDMSKATRFGIQILDHEPGLQQSLIRFSSVQVWIINLVSGLSK